jgi:hypothetical protein
MIRIAIDDLDDSRLEIADFIPTGPKLKLFPRAGNFQADQQSLVITCANTGKGTLRLRSATLIGSNPDHFTFSGPGFPILLGAGNRVQFTIKYHEKGETSQTHLARFIVRSEEDSKAAYLIRRR